MLILFLNQKSDFLPNLVWYCQAFSGQKAFINFLQGHKYSNCPSIIEQQSLGISTVIDAIESASDTCDEVKGYKF